MKENFYFTFGQKYRDKMHPSFADAHPDGWVRIVAESHLIAHNYAMKLFEGHFGTSYR